jgi:hypothetical protein
MSQEQADYLSYLLRLWLENDSEKPVWRASLENAETGEPKVFASLELLVEFLRQVTGE